MKKILLITDSFTFYEDYINELKKRYDVKVSDISEAVKYISNKPKELGLIIFNINDCVSLYREIKALTSKIPTIFWSQNDDEETLSELEENDDAFLVKLETEDNHLALAVNDLFGELS